jgi:hypothetical protein
MIIEMFLYGFMSAFGWWSANHYVIEPHFPPPIERKEEKKKEEKKPEE